MLIKIISQINFGPSFSIELNLNFDKIDIFLIEPKLENFNRPGLSPKFFIDKFKKNRFVVGGIFFFLSSWLLCGACGGGVVYIGEEEEKQEKKTYWLAE